MVVSPALIRDRLFRSSIGVAGQDGLARHELHTKRTMRNWSRRDTLEDENVIYTLHKVCHHWSW